MISTVLPTPAPPNIAALPPVTKRRQQVDDLDAGMEDFAGSRRGGRGRAPARGSADRACRAAASVRDRRACRRRREAAPARRRRPARGSSRRCRAPTAPRLSPAVLSSATARTVTGSRCCCTSATSGSRPSRSISMPSSIPGRAPAGKRTSTTEPWTAVSRPLVRPSPVAGGSAMLHSCHAPGAPSYLSRRFPL